jgi:hypothetical protein
LKKLKLVNLAFNFKAAAGLRNITENCKLRKYYFYFLRELYSLALVAKVKYNLPVEVSISKIRDFDSYYRTNDWMVKNNNG